MALDIAQFKWVFEHKRHIAWMVNFEPDNAIKRQLYSTYHSCDKLQNHIQAIYHASTVQTLKTKKTTKKLTQQTKLHRNCTE